MDRTLITWSVPNIVSIWLMAAVGFLVAGLIAQLIIKYTGGGAQTSEGSPAPAGTGGY